MMHVYFFENDGQCSWIQKELKEQIPKYLREVIDYNGTKIKFYLILKWIMSNTRGANLKALDEMGLNYVETIEHLPKGAGIYITGYDADVQELEQVRKAGVPIIERPCPWVRQLRTQIMETNSDSHQCIIMIDKDHMVYDCYKSIFPMDTIIVEIDNYKEEIKIHKNEKPVHFLVYATFRKKDAERVIDYINRNFNHPDNILDGYHRTLCNWTRQGLLEEINCEIASRNLQEIWVICSSEGDRSTISILEEVRESGAKPIIIKDSNDIPEKIDDDLRFGVLFAPIPLSTKVKKIKSTIKERFCLEI
jgi:4-hydroxy-3-methylbut-2-enyl diphosphate reductase IspH